MFTDTVGSAIKNKILSWFAQYQRNLPWRETYNPYHVWISEIMLQQTQMDRGVVYFKRWLEEFPDVYTLAEASEQKVMKAWEGLGYYSRARNIMKASGLLVEQHGGIIPDNYDQLLALPGIGPYTAGAIMSIAFDQPYPVIDANVERLFARLGDVAKPMKDKNVHKRLKNTLVNILQDVSPRDFNQGLMELGALVCTPANPDCRNCPVQDCCNAFKEDTVAERPVKKKKQEIIDIVMACTIVEKNNKILIQQRNNDDIWGGLWEFPGGRLKNGESAEEAARRELYEETELKTDTLESFEKVTHYYTKYRVTLHSFTCKTCEGSQPKLHAAQQYKWVSLQELDQYAFPSGHRQLIEKMHQRQKTGESK